MSEYDVAINGGEPPDDDELRGVQMGDGRIIACDALFVPPRFVSNRHLLVGLGCERGSDGWVSADNTS
jgi:hypothetical protein